MSRHPLLRFAALIFAPFALPAATPSPAAAASPAPPNIVLIMADDLGFADIGSYGGTRIPTPHLDALAAGGLRFTDYHANGPVCSPTRAALLTGRYQQRAGIDEVVNADPARGHRETHGLQPREVTFAKQLRAAGYRTGLMGKWHLGYAPAFNPRHHGFDEFRGYVSGNVDFHSHVDGAGFADWWHDLELVDEPGYTTHLITRHALRFIEANRDRPFCLYVAHEAPHSPYQGPGDAPIRRAGAKPAKESPTPEHIARAYREMVQEMDRGVGEIVALLARLKLDRSTLVIFCSDNGATRDGNNGPLRGYKGSLWEGGHRVPAIFHWPGTIRPGVTAATALSMDLMPTFLELARAPLPPGHQVDGVSLAPLLLQGQTPPARPLFWAYNNHAAMRDGPWKLLIERGGAPQLFHLDRDLAEAADLAAQEPAKVRELQAALAAWKTEVAATPAQR